MLAVLFSNVSALKTEQNDVFSINAKEKTLREVLDMISEQLAIDINVNDEWAENPISANLLNVNLEKALNQLLRGLDFTVTMNKSGSKVFINIQGHSSKLIEVLNNPDLSGEHPPVTLAQFETLVTTIGTSSEPPYPPPPATPPGDESESKEDENLAEVESVSPPVSVEDFEKAVQALGPSKEPLHPPPPAVIPVNENKNITESDNSGTYQLPPPPLPEHMRSRITGGGH